MEFSTEILEKFIGMHVAQGKITGINIGNSPTTELEELKRIVSEKIKSRFTLENVKDDPGFRAYRDFFWKVGIDPTKTRPASEALVRRILSGGSLPSINTAVDAYNMASAVTGVPIAAFDADKVYGSLIMRFASEGEKFLGIGMKEPVALKPHQAILTDDKEIVAIYPYRDSNDTKITLDTKNVLVISCGVPGISVEKVLESYCLCVKNVIAHNGGSATAGRVYPAP
jgi:DNA/RNA-binding domain of Phe-tRNA-synthetase-like protein